jgi:hypothetical protein
MPNDIRLDTIGFFLARELEHILPTALEVEYADIKYPSILPINSTVSRGKDSYTYRIYDQQGSMRRIADKAKDLPRADVFRREITHKVESYGASFGYTVQELRAAAEVPNTNLEQRRANAVRRVYEETMQRIAYFGDAAAGLRGFFNNDQLDKIVPDKWFDTIGVTPDEQLELLNEPVTRIVQNSNMKEQPNTLLVPYSVFRKISTTRLGTVSDTTVMEFFLDTNEVITDIEPINELTAANSGGFLPKDRIICYNRSADKLEMHLPQPLEFFAPQLTGLEYTVPAHARHGGVAIYYPRSVMVLEKA